MTVVVPGWQLEKPPLRPVDDFDRFAARKTKKKQIQTRLDKNKQINIQLGPTKTAEKPFHDAK